MFLRKTAHTSFLGFNQELASGGKKHWYGNQVQNEIIACFPPSLLHFAQQKISVPPCSPVSGYFTQHILYHHPILKLQFIVQLPMDFPILSHVPIQNLHVAEISIKIH